MRYLLLLVCLCLSLSVVCQNNDYQEIEVETDTVVITANLNIIKSEVAKLNSESKRRLIRDINIELKAADLLINYELEEKMKGWLKVELIDIQNASEDFMFYCKPEYMHGDFGNRITDKPIRSKQIVLANTPTNDNIKWLNGLIKIRLKVTRYEAKVGNRNLDCDAPMPDLKFKRFTVDLIFASVGIGTIIKGESSNRNAKKLYQDYRNSETKAEGDPIYIKANSKHKESLITRAAGIALITAATISTLVKLNNNRLDKKYYTRLCNKKITASPFYNPMSNWAAPNGQTGIVFNFSF